MTGVPTRDKSKRYARSTAWVKTCFFLKMYPPATSTFCFGAADLFVTVSDNLQETYGLTVIEAMASGLPVVAAGWNGYQETVRHGETGFLVPTHMVRTRDDEALLQRIAEGIMGAGHRGRS